MVLTMDGVGEWATTSASIAAPRMKAATPQAGLIVDFVSLFERVESALAFDSDYVQSVIENLDVLKERFATFMREIAHPHLERAQGFPGDKAVESAINAYRMPEVRNAFYDFYRELRVLYEILSPAEALRPFIDDYARLTDLYRILRSNYDSISNPALEELARKTEALVSGRVEGSVPIATQLPIEINDRVLHELKLKNDDDAATVLHLAKSVIASLGGSDPYLISLKERAEDVLDRYSQAQVDPRERLRR